jgi:hypothetical protein
MNDEQYLEYSRALLVEFSNTLAARTRDLPQEHAIRSLASDYQSLGEPGTDLYTRGADLVTKLFNSFPEFAPTFPRQLLWFFGGDCLHYLTDEEIAQFQQLEDLRLAAASCGDAFNFEDARAKLLKLH